MEASTEQIHIGRCIEKGNNVIVSAIAGAGKSSVILSTTILCSDKIFLSLTYNASLKSEIREKVTLAGIENMMVHSYHSLAVQFYDPHCHNDLVLEHIIKTNKRPTKIIPKFSVISIDECQDMNPIYYQFVRKFIYDLGYQPTMVLLGDPYQELYGFKGADKRYLTLGDRLWNSEFHLLTLSKTYRLTGNIVKFVNQVLVGCNRIEAHKDDGEKVIYLRDTDKNMCDHIVEDIIRLIKNKIIYPSDIFVLAASTKNRCLRLLENKFVLHGIGCYVAEGTDYDTDVTQYKATFTTFHQSKGMEKKVVIMCGFDASYFKYYAKDISTLVCPPPLYVGPTRASYKLYLMDNKSEGPLPFLHMSYNEMKKMDFIDFRGNTTIKKEVKKNITDKVHNTTPYDITRFLSIELTAVLTTLLGDMFTTLEEKGDIIPIPKKISLNGVVYEDVTNINNIIIMSYYEYITQNSNTIYDVMTDITVKKHPMLKNALKSLERPEHINEFTKMAVLYHAMTEKLYYKWEQITTYDWITQEHMNDAIKRLTFLGNMSWHVSLKYTFDKIAEVGVVNITGSIDAQNDDDNILVLCTDTITLEHKLQLIIYAYMNNKNYKILNIITGELLQLNYSSKISVVFETLLRHKYEERDVLDDNQFIKQCIT